MLRRFISLQRVVIYREFASKQPKTSSSPALELDKEASSTDFDPFEATSEGDTLRQIDTRLKPRHRILISGGIPPVEFEWEKTRTAKRQRFGQFGLASGVKLEELWPTAEEIEEEEAVGLYREYTAVLAEHRKLVDEKKKKEAAREKELLANIKKYPAELEKYKASLVKAEKEKDERELALEKRIREIQEYFGYWMDPSDPRFEVMMQQKEAEEKKAAKMAKRAEKEKKKFAEVV